jgi:tetratricopeptide (TPR) repeat protein
MSPEQRSAFFQRISEIYEKIGSTKEAIRLLEQAAKEHPTHLSIYLRLARLHGEGAPSKAEESLAYAEERLAAISLSPARRALVLNHIAELYEDLERKKDAVRVLMQATELEAPLASSFVRLAFLHVKDDPNRAVEILLTARKRFPKSPFVLTSLGDVYSHQKRFADAIQVYEQTKDILDNRTNEEPFTDDFYQHFYHNFGSAYERSGQHDKAEEVFHRCLRLFPETHEVLNYLAYMWAEKGIKLEKALEFVTRALKHEPRNGAYLDTLGWVYYQQAKYPQALEQIQKASTIIKDDPVITDHLGDIFKALNDIEKAIMHWKRSFMLDPENKAVAGKLREKGVDVEKLRDEAKKALEENKKKEEPEHGDAGKTPSD